MKNFTMILVVLLIAATTAGQTPGRGANRMTTARISENNHHPVNKGSVSKDKRNDDHHDYGRVKPGTPDFNKNNYHASNRIFEGGREIRYYYPAPPRPLEYRRIYAPYRVPVNFMLIWTPEIRFEYFRFYPVLGYNKYPVGYRIINVSAYDAYEYRGEIANVYGKVYEVYYSRSTDEYILYFGAYYPYHDFTTVIPGKVARRFSPWPERYFNKEHLIITGLIALYEGKPEIAVQAEKQVRLY